MSICSKAMVANLNIGLWLGHRLDREATRKVVEGAGAATDAARVNKHLVPKEALKPVQTAASAIRLHFYDKTLPWKDNGDRLLTRAMYMPFIEEHERLTTRFNQEVVTFLDDTYLEARERAAFRMGDLFKSDDYPGPESLRRRFYVNLDIDIVTQAGDFRVQMDDEEVATIQQNMERAMQERLGKAMHDLWERLADTVGHFAGKMGSNEVFRDSTVRKLQEVVDLLPSLNVLDDPDLEAIRCDIRDRLTGFTPADLRNDKGTRAEAARQANQIMDRLGGFMKAMGAAA